MSLSIAFNAAVFGLGNSEKKIAIAAGNITNADRAGYTRKVLHNTYGVSGFISIPVDGKPAHAVVDNLLIKQVIGQAATASYKATTYEYLNRYARAFGGIGGGASSLSTNTDGLLSALKQLEANPTDSSAKSQVVSAAQMLTATLNQLSQSVQSERLRAEHDIDATITTINVSLQKIADINRQIGVADSSGSNVPDLEDQRNQALQELSQLMGIQYFIDDNNQAQVYANAGGAMVISGYAKQLSFTPVGSVTASMTYPANFNPISLNGVDITSASLGGKLGSLIELRDDKLPDEQAKLDVFADKMQLVVNRILNQGATYPSLNTITSSTTVTTATSLSGATGSFRVAVTDQNGVVQQFADINLATLSPATVAGLVSALNGITGVSASVNSNGKLEVKATNASYGISMNPMTSSFGGESITQFFGFNNLFVNNSTGAGSIQVNSVLAGNSGALATGVLSSSATLATGDYGLSNGDNSIATSLIDALQTPQSFLAAGNFGGMTATFVNYSGAIISDIAVHASSAKSESEAAQASFSYLSDTMTNLMGVNIDEETAQLAVLQTSYQANAQMIATVKQLYEVLMRALGQ